jgi:hypothetical protein
LQIQELLSKSLQLAMKVEKLINLLWSKLISSKGQLRIKIRNGSTIRLLRKMERIM